MPDIHLNGDPREIMRSLFVSCLILFSFILYHVAATCVLKSGGEMPEEGQCAGPMQRALLRRSRVPVTNGGCPIDQILYYPDNDPTATPKVICATARYSLGDFALVWPVHSRRNWRLRSSQALWHWRILRWQRNLRSHIHPSVVGVGVSLRTGRTFCSWMVWPRA